MAPVSVLFVCMGNICRSPMAEALFRNLVSDAGLADRFEIDSAGTDGWHVGSPPHEQTQHQLNLNGVAVGDQRSRLLTAEDLARFSYVIPMDDLNLAGIEQLRNEAATSDVSLLLDYASDPALRDLREVPDPYMVGGYDRVYEMLTDACAGLLASLCEREPALGHKVVAGD